MFFSDKHPFTHISRSILFPHALPDEKQEPLARALETLNISTASAGEPYRERECKMNGTEGTNHATRLVSSSSENFCSNSPSTTSHRIQTPSSLFSLSQQSRMYLHGRRFAASAAAPPPPPPAAAGLLPGTVVAGVPQSAAVFPGDVFPGGAAVASSACASSVAAGVAFSKGMPSAASAFEERIYHAFCTRIEKEEDFGRRKGRTKRSRKIQNAGDTAAASSSCCLLPDQYATMTSSGYSATSTNASTHQKNKGGAIREKEAATVASSPAAAVEQTAGERIPGLVHSVRDRRKKPLSLFYCDTLSGCTPVAREDRGEEERGIHRPEGTANIDDQRKEDDGTAADVIMPGCNSNHSRRRSCFESRKRCANMFSTQETSPWLLDVKEDRLRTAHNKSIPCEESTTTTSRSSTECNSSCSTGLNSSTGLCSCSSMGSTSNITWSSSSSRAEYDRHGLSDSNHCSNDVCNDGGRDEKQRNFLLCENASNFAADRQCYRPHICSSNSNTNNKSSNNSNSKSSSFYGKCTTGNTREKEGKIEAPEDTTAAAAGVAALRRRRRVIGSSPVKEREVAAKEEAQKRRQLGGIAGLLRSFFSAARTGFNTQQQQQQSENAPATNSDSSLFHVDQQKRGLLQQVQQSYNLKEQQHLYRRRHPQPQWQHQQQQQHTQWQPQWQQQQQNIPFLLSEPITSLPVAAAGPELMEEEAYHSPAGSAHVSPDSNCYSKSGTRCPTSRKRLAYHHQPAVAAFCCSAPSYSPFAAPNDQSSCRISPQHVTLREPENAAAPATCLEGTAQVNTGANSCVSAFPCTFSSSPAVIHFSSERQNESTAVEALTADAAIGILALAEAAAPALLQHQPTAKTCSVIAIATDLGQRIIRLIWSCCWVCVLLWLLLHVAIALHSDIVETEQQQQVQAAAAAARCRQQHRENKCEVLHPLPPFLQQPCAEWKACSMRHPQKHASRTKLAANVVGDVLNTFFRKLEWRTIASLALLLAAGIYATALLSTNSSSVCPAPCALPRAGSALHDTKSKSTDAATAAALFCKQLLLQLQQAPRGITDQNATRCLPSSATKIKQRQSISTPMATRTAEAAGISSHQNRHVHGRSDKELWKEEQFCTRFADIRLENACGAAAAPMYSELPFMEGMRRNRILYALPEIAIAKKTGEESSYIQNPSTTAAASTRRTQQGELDPWNSSLNRQQSQWQMLPQGTGALETAEKGTPRKDVFSWMFRGG